ncbi:MAG TPA: hypothetical protein VFF02_05990 [Anaeromyxobacteraceae bacterium]|jgi:hypothetical protein|nr:hypothetical protein [Anaeromyxobacteraceae bacterium]
MRPDLATLSEAVGWAATAVFVGSYFFRRAEALARVQMLGALLWAGYGVLVRAPPVVAANVLVLAAAAWKARRPGAASGGSPE